MNPDRSQQIQRIVRDASEREPAERDRFVEAECGQDAQLRGEVESLLALARERTGVFAHDHEPAAPSGQDDPPRVGEHLGTCAKVCAVVRRHPVAAAAAALLIVALVSGLTVSAWQAGIARAERAKAVQQRFDHARELVRSVLLDDGDRIAALPGSTAVRQRLVQDALKYLHHLPKEAACDPALLRDLAAAYEKIAAVQGGAAASASGDVLSAQHLDDTAGAIASHQKAITIREQIAAISRNDPADQEALANAYTTVAGLYLYSGSPQRAVDYLQKALPIAESLLASNAPSESVRHLSCRVYRGLGQAFGSAAAPGLADARSALAYMRGGLKLQEGLAADFPTKIEHRQALAQTYSALGAIYSAIGEHEEQLEQNRKALAVARALVAVQPNHNSCHRELAAQLGNVGSALVQLNDKPGALEHFREALAIYEALVAADPSDVAVRSHRAVAQRNVGVAIGGSDATAATQHFQKALEAQAEIAATDSRDNDFRRQWAFTYLAKSRFQLESNDPAAAVASAREGIRIGEELVRSSSANAAAQNTLALLFTQLGAAHADSAAREQEPPDEWRNARDAYANALTIYERLKVNGKLSGADAAKPEELAREVAKCDAALH